MIMSPITKLIIEHLKQRPAARAQDIYKLLYQGVFGVGHIFSDRAWDILVEEAGRISLDEHLDDPLFEPVSPDGSMVRVNLRQYINQGGDLGALYEVMKKSATHTGDPDVFLGYWSIFKKLVSEEDLMVDAGEVKMLDELIERESVKPMHHTGAYREAYYPAYRVVQMDIYRENIDARG